LKRIANDRARCEAWALAIAQALNTTPPAYVTNPETGYPYQVLSDASMVEVVGLTTEQWPRAIRLPIR
jgi:hypothetical protein